MSIDQDRQAGDIAVLAHVLAAIFKSLRSNKADRAKGGPVLVSVCQHQDYRPLACASGFKGAIGTACRRGSWARFSSRISRLCCNTWGAAHCRTQAAPSAILS